MNEAHGQWKITIQDNCVLQWFSGIWNEEAMIAYTTEFKEKTSHLNGTKWAILSLFDDWVLGTPAVESYGQKHCAAFKRNGCIKDCHIYQPNYLKEQQLEKMISSSESDYERRVFQQTQEAVDWLQSCGFTADVERFIKTIGQASNTY